MDIQSGGERRPDEPAHKVSMGINGDDTRPAPRSTVKNVMIKAEGPMGIK